MLEEEEDDDYYYEATKRRLALFILVSAGETDRIDSGENESRFRKDNKRMVSPRPLLIQLLLF